MARRPEILAPCGDEAALAAALAAGADAVYFGLAEGFNARARAESFTLAALPATVARIHRAGARAYLTVNTLVFDSELDTVERLLRAVIAAGVDALIVQDPAVALIARALGPIELHASTQMTISSPEGAELARALGISRVVVPRELSVAEIRQFAAASDLELEVFIHGALCVSWSGQCLTSEAWGGRSANRGQCAQACRLPYDLVVDGARRDLGDVAYLLSPKDLAGVRAVAELAAIGVHSLKIEGRYKSADYVTATVAAYRQLVLDAAAGRPAAAPPLADLALAYSRGLSDGFLGGSDHQGLVEGRFPTHRGVYLGRVVAVEGDEVEVARDVEGRPWTGALALGAGRPATAQGATAVALPGPGLEPTVEPSPGMGVGFDGGAPGRDEPGGPIFRVARTARGVRLGFGRPGPDLSQVRAGMRVWITSSPAAARRAAELAGRSVHGRLPLDLAVSGAAGEGLVARARAVGHEVRTASASTLAPARTGGLDEPMLRDKLGSLGGTAFHLRQLDLGELAPGLHLPVSELKAMRRALVAELDGALAAAPPVRVTEAPVVPALRARLAAGPAPVGPPLLVPLCRTSAQLEAAIAAGVAEVELDWMELVGLGQAVARARGAGLRVVIATVRIQKPGEAGYDARIARLEPDGVLVRHLGALVHFAGLPDAARPVLHGDFSLNVTNALSAGHFLGRGLATATAAHDLDAIQLAALLDAVPAGRMAVTIHHHIPMFHTEHCVYAHTLSSGRDFRSCGRPCEAHQVELADRVGHRHPVVVDVGCRNTVFNAAAQSAAALVPSLVARGIGRLRVELVRESQAETARVLAAYAALVAGQIEPAEAVARARVHEQFGVTRGTMKVLG